MEISVLKKGRLISTTSGSAYPETHMRIVRLGDKEVGIGVYLDESDIPESAIILEDNKAVVLNELDGGHPVDEACRKELERLFNRAFPIKDAS